MVALQAIVTALTVSLVLAATRLTVEIEAIDARRLDEVGPGNASTATMTVRPADS